MENHHDGRWSSRTPSVLDSCFISFQHLENLDFIYLDELNIYSSMNSSSKYYVKEHCYD